MSRIPVIAYPDLPVGFSFDMWTQPDGNVYRAHVTLRKHVKVLGFTVPVRIGTKDGTVDTVSEEALDAHLAAMARRLAAEKIGLPE